MIRLAALCLLALLTPAPAADTILMWVDADGRRQYRNFADGEQVEVPAGAVFYRITESEDIPISSYRPDSAASPAPDRGPPPTVIDRATLPTRKLRPAE